VSTDDERTPTDDEAMGMAWWNGMSVPERREVMRQAQAFDGSVSLAQAWRLWKAGRISMSPEIDPEPMAEAA
jgi:hypothetical protein